MAAWSGGNKSNTREGEGQKGSGGDDEAMRRSQERGRAAATDSGTRHKGGCSTVWVPHPQGLPFAGSHLPGSLIPGVDRQGCF